MFLLTDKGGRIVASWSVAGLFIAATLTFVFESGQTIGLMG